MTEPEKLPLTSMDIADQRRQELKALFPGVFTETKGEKDRLVESIDFEKLKAELGTFSDVFESRRERFGMEWPGKKDSLRLIQQPSAGTLKPDRDNSVEFDTSENLIIEGDNLEVLKLLQKSYFSKVKMIYVDPPYNTGGDFIYPDDFSETLETYMSYAGLAGDEGKRFSTNTSGEGRFHTRWLNMMYPRMYLARNLLRDDGLIFVSIDDNEKTNLQSLMDGIFGAENRVGVIAWKNKYGAGAKTKGFIEVHEYILCYSKNAVSDVASELSSDQIADFEKNRDEKYDIRGGFVTQPLMTNSLGDRVNLQYPIEYEGETIKPRKQWVWERERLLRAIENDEVVIKRKRNGDFSVRAKVYLRNEDGTLRKGKPLSLLNGPFNQDGSKEVSELLGDGVFSFPKPSALVKKLFGFTVNGEEDRSGLYLDFFAGSGTSGQAVLDLNNEDGGNRNFILIQLPEPCGEGTSARKAGLHDIAAICRKRVEKVIEKNVARLSDQDELPGISEPKNDTPIGFRSFTLNKSTLLPWPTIGADSTEDELAKQLTLHIDHVASDADQEDILFELLLKAGFKLQEKIDKLELANQLVFSIAEGALLICLSDEITRELIDAVAEAEPMQFICLDRAFKGNDQLKANAVQTFAARNQGREKAEQIIFRTV